MQITWIAKLGSWTRKIKAHSSAEAIDKAAFLLIESGIDDITGLVVTR